ncbi:MAG: hypothetical protein QGI21_03350 [Candidatus Poseidoniaceae archaeon]|jgi:hypothetical protein|nr:hypothetical protein [Candidatus Poseidoniaceae archaeon]
MPLVDSEKNLLDSELNHQLGQKFSTYKGLILDKSGFQWTLWRLDALEAWWRFFEETIDTPMGRKLANAACDEEEFLISSGELLERGFFKKKKMQKLIMKRWKLHGWGLPFFSNCGADDTIYTPIAAGILQANMENIESTRYRMLWEEKGPGSFILDLENSNLPIQPPKPVAENILDTGDEFTMDIEKGWRIDGQRYCLLPLGLFTRLESFCVGFHCSIDDDERKSWSGLDEGALAISIAMKRLYIAGEEIFLAIDREGWIDSANNLLSVRGMGHVQDVTLIDGNGGVGIDFFETPSPFVVGLLAGAWTRCEGRPVRVDFEGKTIKLFSRHELA